ncbi:hypothetical protein OPV22_030870 [Ensete ventricosum]|uniref:Uncharacterized protein n=1 Tax=Ensete ventricosum TaxID=4639 RepID=A0AAV8PIE3_ENSVE|nr:hypothetical protein OPV22_030870 [Ensete ventricosum]
MESNATLWAGLKAYQHPSKQRYGDQTNSTECFVLKLLLLPGNAAACEEEQQQECYSLLTVRRGGVSWIRSPSSAIRRPLQCVVSSALLWFHRDGMESHPKREKEREGKA